MPGTLQKTPPFCLCGSLLSSKGGLLVEGESPQGQDDLGVNPVSTSSCVATGRLLTSLSLAPRPAYPATWSEHLFCC